MSNPKVLFVTCFVFLSSLTAFGSDQWQSFSVNEKRNSLGGNTKDSSGTLYAECSQGRLVFEAPGQVVLMDPQKDAMTIVDHNKKQFHALTKQDFERFMAFAIQVSGLVNKQDSDENNLLSAIFGVKEFNPQATAKLYSASGKSQKVDDRSAQQVSRDFAIESGGSKFQVRHEYWFTKELPTFAPDACKIDMSAFAVGALKAKAELSEELGKKFGTALRSSLVVKNSAGEVILQKEQEFTDFKDQATVKPELLKVPEGYTQLPTMTAEQQEQMLKHFQQQLKQQQGGK